MSDTVAIACPYCHEVVEIYVDPETEGVMVEDCAVCCRPWSLHVSRDFDGEPLVQVSRAQ